MLSWVFDLVSHLTRAWPYLNNIATWGFQCSGHSSSEARTIAGNAYSRIKKKQIRVQKQRQKKQIVLPAIVRHRQMTRWEWAQSVSEYVISLSSNDLF